MPEAWKKDFILGARQVSSFSLVDLIQYMDTEKTIADNQIDSGRGHGRGGRSGCGRQDGRDGYGGRGGNYFTRKSQYTQYNNDRNVR